MNESKHSRKLEFPDSITEGLRQLEKICAHDYARASPSPQEKIASIVDDFIFSDFDRRIGRKRQLTPVKELQILEKVASYFSDQKHEAQHVIFLWLFMPGKRLGKLHLSILTKLVSVAIADSNSNLLNYAAMWMQMSGCQSETPCFLIDMISKDYFTLIPSLMDHLKQLPVVSPLFCSSFLCSLTSIYSIVPPTVKITELTLEWLSTSPATCFAPLKMVSPHKHPGPQTPLPGLVHWCTIVPLLLRAENFGKDSIELWTLLSRLHLKVLEIVKSFAHTEPTLQHYKITLVQPNTLSDLIAECRRSRVAGEDIQLVLDRLGQILQVSLSSNCLKDGSDIFAKLSELPYNRLLSIVKERWKYAA